MGSILQDTKKTLGLAEDAVGFDDELIIHINSVLSDMNQLGVGPEAGFEISSADETWEQFLGPGARLNHAKSFMYLRVKMLFDPPQTGYVLTAYEKLIEKAEWRLNIQAEEPSSILVGGMTEIVGNAGDEYSLRLNNPDGLTLIELGSEYEAEFVAEGSTNAESVTLELGEIGDGVLVLPIVIRTGTYIVRRLDPRRTIITIKVVAR